MPNRRTYTDDQLRDAIAGASVWADVAETLGRQRDYSTQWWQKRAADLDIDVSHLGHTRCAKPVEAVDLPFSLPAGNRLCTGLTLAMRWFLERGYLVSVPLEPAPYDLVVESDAGLKRIQVKSTQNQSTGGRYQVRISRKLYDREAGHRNAAGQRREARYRPHEVDFFFIIAGGKTYYLIPLAVTKSRTSLVLDSKYTRFCVDVE